MQLLAIAVELLLKFYPQGHVMLHAEHRNDELTADHGLLTLQRLASALDA